MVYCLQLASYGDWAQARLLESWLHPLLIMFSFDSNLL